MEKKQKQSTENFIKDIRRKTRRVFSSEQKIMIVMEAQRGEQSVAELYPQTCYLPGHVLQMEQRVHGSW